MMRNGVRSACANEMFNGNIAMRYKLHAWDLSCVDGASPNEKTMFCALYWQAVCSGFHVPF